MNITKYQHACFTVEKDGQVLVVDPGNFSSDFIAPAAVVAVVVTHEHGDHFDHELVAAIHDKNPDALVIGPASVTDKVEIGETRAVAPGDSVTIGPFTLTFSGGEHARIHQSIPLIENIGVMINDLLYYPGDSLYIPEQAVDTLALPAAAPWMKIGETIDYLLAVRPRFAFPTHDAILSEAGQTVVDQLLARFAANNDIDYKRIDAAPYSV